jgi:hypothetical protein
MYSEETAMPYLNEGKKAIAMDGKLPTSNKVINLPQPVRIPPPNAAKGK